MTNEEKATLIAAMQAESAKIEQLEKEFGIPLASPNPTDAEIMDDTALSGRDYDDYENDLQDDYYANWCTHK